jgi:hypothetical protein
VKTYDVLYQVEGEEKFSLGSGMAVKAISKKEALQRAKAKIAKRKNKVKAYDFHVLDIRSKIKSKDKT